MNNHCFHLIFSQVHGFLIPVAERSTRQRRKGPGKGAGLVATLLVLSASASAEMVVDPNSSGTSVSQSINNVPVINIADPNGKGLSHNRFTELNVDLPGVIFNNSQTDGASQIGGYVMKNPGLTRHATAILSEVTGNNPSSLRGTLEVFGGRADLIIANPNGLTINGVTTLNSNSLLLTSGRVQAGDGNLQFTVDDRSGRVTVGSGGIDTTGLSYFDIVARSIALNGAVGSPGSATAITLVAGLNAWDPGSRSHARAANSEANTPAVAIEGSVAGAMYGRMIALIATESGAGVRHQGVIRAAEDIRVEADGDLSLADVSGLGSVLASGANVDVGNLAAGHDMTLSASAAMNIGAINAGRDVALDSRGDLRLGRGLVGDGAVAGRKLQVRSQGAIINQLGSLLHAGTELTLNAGDRLRNTSHSTIKGDSVQIAAQSVENSNQSSIAATRQLSIKTSGNLRNLHGSVLKATQLEIDVQNMENRDTASVSGSQSLTIKARGLSNHDKSQLSGGAVLLEVLGTFSNDQSLTKADSTLRVTATHIDNRNSAVISGPALTLSSTADVTNSTGASVSASGSAVIEAAAHLLNDNASISGPALTLRGANVSNRNGAEIVTAGRVAISATDTFGSSGKALIRGPDIAIDSQHFVATDSRILATSHLALNTTSFVNSATLEASKTAALTLSNGADLLIDAEHKAPVAGQLLTLNARDVRIDGTLNNPGKVRINATNNVSNNGRIVTGDSLEVVAGGSIDNLSGGLIWAAKDIVLQAGTRITNWSNGLIMAMHDLVLQANVAIYNKAGRIEAGADLKADAPLLENRSEYTGSSSVDGEAKEDTWYAESYKTFESQYWHIELTMPVYRSNIAVTRRAVIKAGGNLLLNQSKVSSTAATVRNIAGVMAAKENLRVVGNVENLGVFSSTSLADLLKATDAYARWTNSGPYDDDDPFRGNLYDLLDRHFLSSDGWGEKWLFSLKRVETTSVNQLLSAVLGAEWKSLDRSALVARWAAFKNASGKTLDFYADQQAELSAGLKLTHSGGTLTNGTGATTAENRQVEVQIGDEKVQTVDGQLDASYNHNSALNVSGEFDLEALRAAINAADVLQAQVSSALFGRRAAERNSDTSKAPRVRPLYETRIEYLDQSHFHGSEYFFNMVNYNPQKTPTVLGDAYFDNQLVLSNVEQVMGNFFARTQQLAGTELVKNLLDNAASEIVALGLVMGEPLSKEQYEKLSHDIVWYEPQQVDGETVLAPRLYLSKASLQARQQEQKNAAQISAQNVLIEADALNNINGLIRADNDTFVYANGDINNRSSGGTDTGIHGGEQGRVVVAAEGQVLNQGGNIAARHVTVVGGKGVTSSATAGYDDTGSLLLRNNGLLGAGITEEGSRAQSEHASAPEAAAQPQATEQVVPPNVRQMFDEQVAAAPADSGGTSVTIVSGADINLVGAKTAADSVSLQTTGNLNMEAVHEVSSSFSSSHETDFLSYKTTRETTAAATSKGNQVDANSLRIRTGGNWSVLGSDINSQLSDVKVGGNATVAAGKDLSMSRTEEDKMTLVFDLAAGGGGHEVGVSAKTLQETEITLDGRSPQDLSINGEVGGGQGSRANSGRGATSGFSMRVGIEETSSVETEQKKTHRNAQLNLGSGSFETGGTFDLGGADINKAHQLDPAERAKLSADDVAAKVAAMPTLAIRAADIKSSKFEDTTVATSSYKAFFVGASVEAHSSLLDVATNIGNTVNKANDGMEVDPGLTAIAQAANVTQVLMSELIGGSGSIGFRYVTETSEDRSRAQNVNQLGGNLSLTSTQGDIDLNGVNLMGGKVALDSAGKLNQRAAKASSSSDYGMDIHTTGITQSYGVAPTGVGMGLSVGAEGLYERTEGATTTYTQGLISGSEVTIKTRGDHNMEGAQVQGNQVNASIGGNQNIRSVQDSSSADHTRGSWSASVGVAVTTDGLIVPTGSASLSGGKDYNNSALTTAQSGIQANALSLKVAGDLSLQGAHVLSETGTVEVGGKLNAQTVQDRHDKDGGYAGGGLGISKNGLPSVSLDVGRVDRIDYQATQHATIDVGDAANVSVAGGTNGTLNQDGDNLQNVTKDKKVAAVDIRITLSGEDMRTAKHKGKKATGRKADHELSSPRSRDREHPENGAPTLSRSVSTESQAEVAADPTPVLVPTKLLGKTAKHAEDGSVQLLKYHRLDSYEQAASKQAEEDGPAGVTLDGRHITANKANGFGFTRQMSAPESPGGLTFDKLPSYLRFDSQEPLLPPDTPIAPDWRHSATDPTDVMPPSGPPRTKNNPLFEE